MNQGTQDCGTSITAAGTTQATATELINGLNGITTAAAGSGVSLFAANPGCLQVIYNGATNPVNVYPPLGAKINSLATNASHVLAPNTGCQYWWLSATQILANLSA